jgi:uncharacterized protein RhaS with RHS repeats
MRTATQLTYMQQRYYDPQIGRLLSVDPSPLAWNRYAYANGNPLTLIDPDGRATVNGFRPDDYAGLFHRIGEAFNLPGYFTIAAHGNVAVLEIQYPESERFERESQITYGLAGLKLGRNGQSVFSLSCRFGMDWGDRGSAAQWVSDEFNTSVYGADGYVNGTQTGDIATLTVWSGEGMTGMQGAFRLFRPGRTRYVRGKSIVAIKVNVKTGEVQLVLEDGSVETYSEPIKRPRQPAPMPPETSSPDEPKRQKPPQA